MMTKEKKLIGFHVVLLIVCGICRIYCQIHMTEWYYRYQNGAMLKICLTYAKPLFYYTAGFLLTYVLARKAFRDDLQLPYKGLGIVGGVLMAMYVFAVLTIELAAFTDIVAKSKVYYFMLSSILDYYWLLCIPGVLFGLAAEKRWQS